MSILPTELIVEILLLLPFAALLRFRCVSKAWRNLIDSPDFAKSHSDRPNKAPDSMLILLGHPKAYQIHLDSVCNSTLKQLTPNPCIGTDDSSYLSVIGPCNGLFCISSTSFCLWNPSTGKHFQVPQLPLDDDEYRIYGFGYDSEEDYKVVCISHRKGGVPVTCDVFVAANFAVWVYSLKSDSWKSIGDFPYLFLGKGQGGVFVGGVVHWTVHHKSLPISPEMIVALDLGKLEYHLVPQPETMENLMVDYLDIELRVGVLDGCLCATYRDRRNNDFDLWVMKEYGVKESWTRLISCSFSTPMCLTPLAYNKAGDVVLWLSPGLSPDGFSWGGLIRYEFETSLLKRVEESFNQEYGPLYPNSPLAFVYSPSLACPQRARNYSMAS